MEFGWFDGAEYGEYNGVGLVEIANVFCDAERLFY